MKRLVLSIALCGLVGSFSFVSDAATFGVPQKMTVGQSPLSQPAVIIATHSTPSAKTQHLVNKVSLDIAVKEKEIAALEASLKVEQDKYSAYSQKHQGKVARSEVRAHEIKISGYNADIEKLQNSVQNLQGVLESL